MKEETLWAACVSGAACLMTGVCMDAERFGLSVSFGVVSFVSILFAGISYLEGPKKEQA